MHSEIKSIFDNFIIENEKIPVSHMKYSGTSNTYVIWTIIGETPALIGNDDPLYSVVQVDFDIYSDKNYLKILDKIKEKMKANDWVWVEDSVEMFENDTQLFHRTTTFEKERNIENG